MSVSIKTVLDENIHRFTLTLVSFEELEKALFTIYGKSVFSIRYQDEDGDLISVSSTGELQEALRVAQGKTLKLLLSRAEGGKQAAGAEKDAKMLAEYQRELETAQQELKLAAEQARQAKAAAAQAFWEAEEERERVAKEVREREEIETAKAQREEEEKAIAQQLADDERLAKEKQAEIDAQDEAERIVQEHEAKIEAERQEQERLAEVAAQKQAKLASIQAFWEEDAKREQTEKEKRAQEEVIVKQASSAIPASQEVSEDNVVHATVMCDVCEVFPIVGTRYQCTVCKDFDLCSSCEAKPSSHPCEHPLLKHKQVVSNVTVHRGVSCDNCNKYPITGARFKCKLCPNFDLCEDCESKDVHPADHPLFKFRLERVRHGFRMGHGFGGGMGQGGGMGRRCGMRRLVKGASGPRVCKLQQRLGIQVDGVFDDKTEEAVRQFQIKNGLIVDGVVGPQTKEKLRQCTPRPTNVFDAVFQLHH